MEEIELLRSHLKEQRFQEATQLTLTRILPEEHLPSQETAWDWLTHPGHHVSVDNRLVKGCPFLLGCLQTVRNEDEGVLESWRDSLASDPAAAFLEEQGQPIRDWHYTQAVLNCGKAALAARRSDYAAVQEYGANAAQWFTGSPPQQDTTKREFANGSSDSVKQCFVAIAQKLEIPVGQVCDMTEWFLSLVQGRAALHRQRIIVPFYENEAIEKEGAVSHLEMELLEGRGEFYADPVTMAFIRWDASFQEAYENAHAYVDQLGYWQEDADVRWRMQADPPLVSLSGGSIGGAFFANLWHLLTRTPNDLSVTVSATIDANGRVGRVSNIWAKIRAILKIPEISEIIVAASQDEVPEQYDRLKIWKVRHAGNPAIHGRPQEG